MTSPLPSRLVTLATSALLAGALLTASPARAQDAKLFDSLEWSGDFRGRVEHFAYKDATPDRTRLRYRLRLGGAAKINEDIRAHFRLGSGYMDVRSTNRTLGSGANSSDPFDADPITIDRAYIEIKNAALPGAKLVFGKMSNPFRWKNGKDYMLWDGDFNPEGVALRWKRAGETSLYANLGYMILDENGSAADPHLFGIQLGADTTRGALQFGARATFYTFSSLDNEQLAALNSDGNLGLSEGYVLPFDGETRPTDDGNDKGFSVYELAAYARCEACIPNWPLLLYFHYAQNPATADFEYTDDPALADYQPFSGDDRNKAFGVGFEIGDKKKNVKLGLGYYRLEADYFPGVLIDSDLTDGKTNREGFTAYAVKRVLRNTDFGVTLFASDILDAGPVELFPTARADRIRVQVDLNVTF